MEDDDKKRNLERIRLHRSLELREYALAAFYPLTRSGISAPRKRAKDDLSVIAAHPLLSALGREHGYQRAPDEPKPWKKPWDK
jgi:hypothetical protein